jgi:chorismate mutase-like protein
MTREEALEALAAHRREVDAIDLELLELLNRRTRVVESIGKIKQAAQLPIYEPRREEEVFRNVAGHNAGPLTTEALKRIFERIIDEMRALQKMRRDGSAGMEQGEKQC